MKRATFFLVINPKLDASVIPRSTLMESAAPLIDAILPRERS